jgi:phytoene/squalene synthetase
MIFQKGFKVMKPTEKIRLEQLDKKTPFKVPKNYFDEFHASMQSQLKQNKTRKMKLHHHLRPYLLAAAVFAGILVLSIPIYQKLHHNAEIPVNEEFKNYVNTEVDEETLVDYIANNDTE